MSNPRSVSTSPTATFVLHAWVDESMHTLVDGTSVYILAAVVADSSRCDSARADFTNLKPRRALKLHWRDESVARQRTISKTVADIDMHAPVVVGTYVNPRKQERARAKCMQALLIELDRLGVTRAWIENRSGSLNRKDEATVLQLRGMHAISRNLQVDMLHPSGEPMLWVSDAIAGAVGADRQGAPECLSLMGTTVTIIEITLD